MSSGIICSQQKVNVYVLFLSLIFWQKISGVSDRALTLLLNTVIAFLELVVFQLDVRVLKTWKAVFFSICNLKVPKSAS